MSKKLAELEKRYNDSLPKEEEIDFDKIFPTESGLKEIEYTPESDEDIVKRAQSAVDSEKTKRKPKSETRIKKRWTHSQRIKTPHEKPSPTAIRICQNSMMS